ncbi:MAG: (2Fe-2S) ferredoxin domain-containing protein [Armatimonadota bacterium]
MKRIEIVVCMGSSCFSRGNSKNLAAIQEYLKDNGVEGSVRLAGSRCEGECMHGPNIRINGELITGVEPDNIKDILDAALSRGDHDDAK